MKLRFLVMAWIGRAFNAAIIALECNHDSPTKYLLASRASAKRRGDSIVSVKCLLAQAIQLPNYIMVTSDE